MLRLVIVNQKNLKYFLSFGVIVLIFSALVGTPYMVIAAFNYLLILYGFLHRKSNRQRHVRFVVSGIILDLALVLLLQFQRDAVGTALSFKLSFLNQAHILTSTIATVLYFPMMITGVMLLKKEHLRNVHRRLGTATILFRTLGFILMYSMIESFKNT
jgi:hypothetical protein